MITGVSTSYACSIDKLSACNETEQRNLVDKASCKQLKKMDADKLVGNARALHHLRVPSCNFGSALGSIFKSPKDNKQQD